MTQETVKVPGQSVRELGDPRCARVDFSLKARELDGEMNLETLTISEGIRSKKSGPRSAIKSLSASDTGAAKRSSITNNREKWRQHNVNRAFVSLRRLVPTYPPEKRLSKNEILRMAIKYIRLLESILEYQNAKIDSHLPSCGGADCSNGSASSGSTDSRCGSLTS